MQNEKRKKKFLVVGLGPIGGIFSCHLKASGCSIYGVDVRKELVKAIRKNGLSIEGLTSLRTHLDQVCTQLSELKEQEFDYVIIAVKTPYMAEVVSSLSRIKDDFKIVSMQNGIDNEEYLAKFFPKERVLRVVINFAGNAISPGVVKMTFFHKPNYVGCLCGKEDCVYTKEFSELMTAAGLETEPTLDVKKLAWRKTILVASLAPISALLGMTMAEVMSMGETRYLVEMLLEEAVEVARGKNFDFGEEFIAYSLKYLSTAGHHKPSMLIDIEKGDPTEIEYINGKISFYGHELDIHAHLNTYLTLLVKAKEQFQIQKKNNAI
jgi:2-dehydropantoate 2-reductase